MVMAARDLTCDVSAKKRKNVLHDIYNSEELEIDSEQSKGLKGVFTPTPKDSNLCLFQEHFASVDNDSIPSTNLVPIYTNNTSCNIYAVT